MTKLLSGKIEWKKIIQDFYKPFEAILEKAEKELEHVEIKDEVSDVPCEKCGKMMVIKYGKYGKFLACPRISRVSKCKTFYSNG